MKIMRTLINTWAYFTDSKNDRLNTYKEIEKNFKKHYFQWIICFLYPED